MKKIFMKKEDNADEEVIKTKDKQSKESKPKKKQKIILVIFLKI